VTMTAGFPRSALVLAVLLGAASGCTALHPTTGDGERSAQQEAEPFAGGTADYDPARSPKQLASWSEVVVQGHIREVVPGRSWASSADDPGRADTITVVVAVEEILDGAMPPGSDGNLYLELPSPGGVEAAVYDDAAPKEEVVVAYATLLPDDRPEPVLDPAAGRPAGQRLATLTTPQGLVLATDAADGPVVDFADAEGVDLCDYLPNALKFPVDADAPAPEADVEPGDT
jgi:hypothetical protein